MYRVRCPVRTENNPLYSRSTVNGDRLLRHPASVRRSAVDDAAREVYHGNDYARMTMYVPFLTVNFRVRRVLPLADRGGDAQKDHAGGVAPAQLPGRWRAGAPWSTPTEQAMP